MFRVLLVALFALAGCAATPPIRWAKEGGNQDQFMQDRYACIQQAQQHRSGAYVNDGTGSAYGTVVISQGMFTSCMGARGYAMDDKGPFVAPAGMIVRVVD